MSDGANIVRREPPAREVTQAVVDHLIAGGASADLVEFAKSHARKPVSMPSQTGDQGKGHPVLFGFAPADVYVDHPDGGGYPIGFLDRAYGTLGVTDPTKVLHLCSGSMRIGVRIDIRPEMQPDIVADCRNVPLPDESFDWVMADPPYSEEYATNLYGTGADYPRPGQILKEASRLLRPGGRVGILHFQVPMHRPPLRMVGVWGISTGAGYAIRAWTVFEKAHAGLWDVA